MSKKVNSGTNVAADTWSSSAGVHSDSYIDSDSLLIHILILIERVNCGKNEAADSWSSSAGVHSDSFINPYIDTDSSTDLDSYIAVLELCE